MKYYALFLEPIGYIEKCLTLIRFICNPKSKSFPHITMRVFKNDGLGTERIQQVNASYLNLFDVDNFNIKEQKPPYIVFIRCESDELEAQEYKPGFPYSYLHITLYKGNNLVFAQRLYKELSSIKWHIKLAFDPPKSLTQRTIGEKIVTASLREQINELFKDILGEYINELPDDDDKKIELIRRIIKKLEEYKGKSNVESAISFYDASDGIDAIDELEKDNSDISKRNAIFITPPEYAQEMAQNAIEFMKDSNIDFGDSSIGTGALYLALLQAIKNSNRTICVRSAIGIDIDSHMAKEAQKRFGSRNLKVKCDDSLLLTDDYFLGHKRNLMLVNPPYTRSSDIDTEYRDKIKERAEKHTGIPISKESGLHVYHLLIMDKWLQDSGIAVWLLPNTLLQTNYGIAAREYLTNNVTLLKIHIYDEKKEQFETANISTALVIFKKEKPNNDSIVAVSHGVSAIDSDTTDIPLSFLRSEKNNWRRIILNTDKQKKYDYKCVIKDLFDVKRGLATGANSFFVLPRERARELGIPEIALKPLLPKSRFFSSTIIESSEDGFPDIAPQLVLIDCDLPETVIKENYPLFYEYLNTARLQPSTGKRVIDRTLVRSRNPWYKQEVRLPPPYLLTYMGRNKKHMPPLYFLLNKSQAVALNTYLLLYPKEWLVELLNEHDDLDKQLLECLNISAKTHISYKTRVYSGNLQKLEPNELRNFEVLDLPPIISRYLERN